MDTLEFSTVGASNITEHIGYLSELGLNFGYGPTSIMQFYYEHVHIMSGLPWWSSILLATVMYRIGILGYPNMIHSDQMARTKAISPVMSKLIAEQRAYMSKNDQMAAMQKSREVKLLRQSAGVSLRKQVAFFGVQGVLGYGTFHLMRSMAELPVPGLETQGVGWLTNLTVPDPYYVLPVTLAITMHYAFKLGNRGAGASSEFAPPNMGGEMTGYLRSAMLYGMPAFICLFMLWMPACLQLSFASTSVLGILQGRLMTQGWFRDLFGLYPLDTTTTEATNAKASSKVIDVPNIAAHSHSAKVMDGYQAPTVRGIAKGLPARGSSSTSGRAGGIMNAVAKPFAPIGRFFSGFMKEAREGVEKMTGQKSGANSEFLRRAAEHESRRKREMEEDKQAREDRAKRGRRQHSKRS